MAFLGDLAGAISSQYGVGESNNTTLNNVILGQNQNYGQLGEFPTDPSATRRYVEEGYLRTDPFQIDSKQFEVLFQEPSATVFIKKRMFSSLAENYRTDFMDQDEKLYFRAMKTLFQNKCAVIAALEKLSKIQKVTSVVGSVSEQLFPIISTLSNTITSNGPPSPTNNLFGGLGASLFTGSSDPTQLANVMNKINKIYAFNTTNYSTTWLTDTSSTFQSLYGQGTGVIEITNFTDLSTTTRCNGIKNDGGSFNLSIVDPYESMLITDWDIEKAIADATNMWSNQSIFNFAQQAVEQTIDDAQSQLNQFRSSRGASPISIMINDNTLTTSSQQVTAIITNLGIELVFTYNSGFGGLGNSVTVSPDYLQGGAIAGNDGLSSGNGVDSSGIRYTTSELTAFNNLISSIYSKLQMDANSRSSFQITNKNTNYARKKLRFNFSGQLIIQPMDVVHIYMQTKSRFDNQISTGFTNMFDGLGILQNTANTIVNLTNTVSTLFNPSGNVDMQAEKQVYVGSSFPNYLWSLLRSQFVNEKEGVHVFAGLVDNVGDSWSDGKFLASISGRDNLAYFDLGKINFKPGVDNFLGSAYDPLTPFKSNFDTITSTAKSVTPQLLDENVILLGTSQNPGILKAKAGPQAGQKVTSDTIFQGTLINNNTDQTSKEIFAPDGLVYKWKEGIGVFTQFGNSLELNDPNKVGQPNIANEPFAGQDVLNTISLLITGQPYNYANFWKASASLNGFNNDPQTGQDSAFNYISSLKNDLTKNNLSWGNFIPFKKLSIDEQSYAQAMQAQFRINQKNTDLDNKIQQISVLNQQAAMFGAVNILGTPASGNSALNPAFLALQAQMKNLTNSITQDISNIQAQDASFNKLANASGPDASFDYSDFTNSSSVSSSVTDANVRKTLRRKLNYLTRRMSYDVRANQDKNLFIVDDSYDKDYDLMAYNQSLKNGTSLYSNDFSSVREKIRQAADLLDLEVYCDTQGHIRVRPPQYNNMPSSVFYKMLYLKQAYGIQIFPQFLSDIFGDQLGNLKTQLEISEDMIRLFCAILGYNDDGSASNFITTTGLTYNSGSSFSFISDTSDNISNISGILGSANFDQTQVQPFLNTLQESSKIGFSNSQKYAAIVSTLQAAVSANSGINTSLSTLNSNTYVQTLINRIKTKSGNSIILSKVDYVTSNSDGQQAVITSASTGASVDIFKVTNDLQSQIQSRQKTIKLFASAIKNAAEYRSLDATNALSSTSTGNSLVNPPTYNNSNIPEVYQHMIEDETYDDLGVGSGSRYIIQRAQIKGIQINVNKPQYSTVQVQGQLNIYDNDNSSLPAGLASFPNNGNGLVTALAVDYDTWRNYGVIEPSVIPVPFLSDPNSQCAPYASMLLSRARKNILRGSVTISGNEYMQPGEVIFLEDRQLLFYVESVKHNFRYGQSFTTTLELTYGHSPGDYIPTVLDVIGKMIYNNRDIGSYTIQRQTNSGNEKDLGVVLQDPSGSNTLQTDNSSPTTNYSSFNNSVINNILYTAGPTINANNTPGNNVTAKLELRIYYDNNNAINSNLQAFANNVQSMLTGGTGLSLSVQSNTLPNSSVSVVPVNIDDKTVRKSPSQRAVDAARNQVTTTSTSGGVGFVASTLGATTSTPPPSIKALQQALYGYIVDCWLVFSQSTGS